MMKTYAMLRQPVATKTLPGDGDNELAARTGYHAVVGPVRTKGRAEPGIATQVVGRALDGGSDAARRERRCDLAYGIRGRGRRATSCCAGIVSGVVGVRRCGRGVGIGSVRVGRSNSRAGHSGSCDSGRSGPATTVGAP